MAERTVTSRWIPSIAIAIPAALVIALVSAFVHEPIAALTFGIGIWFLLIAIFRPAYAIYAMGLVVPLSFMALKIFGPESHLSLEKPIGVVTLITLAIQFAVTRRPFERDKTITLLALYFGTCFLSLLVAEHPSLTWQFLSIHLMLFAFSIATVNIIRDLPSLKGMVHAMMLGALVASAIAIWESQTASHLFQVEHKGTLLWEGAERVWSTVGDANFLALVLVSAIPIAYFCFLTAKSLALKVLYLATAAVLSAGIFVSLSRGGLVALSAAAVLIFFITVHKRSTWLITVVIFITAWFMIPNSVWTRFLSIGDYSRDPSIYQRVHILESGISMLKGHFFLGVGAGNFPQKYMDYLSPLEEREPRAAHNTPLEIAAETGVVGLICYALLFAYALMNFHRARRHVRGDPDSANKRWLIGLSYGLEVALVAQMASMCFISALWVKSFWITIALGICLKKIAERRAYESSNSGIGGGAAPAKQGSPSAVSVDAA